MKSSRNLKVGVILLVIALAVGVFALVIWADGNGTYGMSRRADAPDHDGDGIPNGQDEDYVSDCDEECDGTCVGEPKGSGMRRNIYENENDNISELPVHINGRELKIMSIEKIAQVLGIDANQLLEEIKNEFGLTRKFNIGNTLDDLRGEYRFSPYQIMEIAERIKTASAE